MEAETDYKRQLNHASVHLAKLREDIVALDRCAEAAGIRSIETFDDLSKVLFPQQVYKSYPKSYLKPENRRQLTQWLQQLCAVRLPEDELTTAPTIDEWIDTLANLADIWLVHSFGTGGKLSLVPRARMEWLSGAQHVDGEIRKFSGGLADVLATPRPVIQPTFEYGATAATRAVQTIRELSLPAREAIYLHPKQRRSADALLMSRAADSKSPLPDPDQMSRFFDQAKSKFAGEDVYIFGVWPVLYDVASDALSKGIHHVFGPGSVLHTGGGTKARALPSDFTDSVKKFVGTEQVFEFYSMTEIIPAFPKCRFGNYHVPSSVVCCVMDVASGSVLDTSKVNRGQFAFLDLLASMYWGGITTGDVVTLSGTNDRCDCGNAGRYLFDVARLDAVAGGDDKISCADTAPGT